MIRKLLAAAALSLLTSMSAHAEFYAGAGIGISEPDDSTLSNHITYKFLAGYQFIEHVAIEASFVNMGRLAVDSATINHISGGSASSTSLDVSGYDLSVVGFLPLIDKVALFGRVGYFAWDADLNASIQGVGRVSEGDSGQDPSFGFGFSMNPIEPLSLNLEWTRFDILDNNVEYFGLGLKVKF